MEASQSALRASCCQECCQVGRGRLARYVLVALLVLLAIVPAAGAQRRPLSAPPPHLNAWLAIAKCEQPKPGGWGKWGSVHWHQTHNYGFPGGAGMTPILWTLHRRPHMRGVKTMDQASPLEQVWAMYRFWVWAEKTYPGYGWTGWECSSDIGWRTSDPGDLARRYP